MLNFPCSPAAIFTGRLTSPGLIFVGIWKMLIAVPWNDECDVVELGLCGLDCLRHQ